MPKPRLYGADVVVLRQQDYGEADRILTLLSSEGKLTALARGIRRTTSRKSGHLGLFEQAHVMLAHGRNMETVTQAESITSYPELNGNLLRFTYACYLAELVDRFVQPDEECVDIYTLLCAGLEWVAHNADLALWARYFELRLLALAGYQPELFACVQCGREIAPVDNSFSPENGGVVCAACGQDIPHLIPFAVSAQRVLRFLTTREPSEVARLRLTDTTHSQIEHILLRYLEYTLERELRSVAFLRRLRRDIAALSQPRDHAPAI